MWASSPQKVVAWASSPQKVVAWASSPQKVVAWASSPQKVVAWASSPQKVVAWASSPQKVVAWASSPQTAATTPFGICWPACRKTSRCRLAAESAICGPSPCALDAGAAAVVIGTMLFADPETVQWALDLFGRTSLIAALDCDGGDADGAK